MSETGNTFQCETVGELKLLLDKIPNELRVRLEVSRKLELGIQLSSRENLSEIIVAKNKIVLRALDREGWNTESN